MAHPLVRLFVLSGILYTILFSIHVSIVTFLVIDLIIALILTICTLFGLPHVTIVKFSSAVLRAWFSIFMGHLEHFGRLTVVLTGDAFHPDEPALVVCNHRSWADTVVLYSLARQVRMHGDVKFLAKRPLLLFPVYGFTGWILDVVIFIKRQSTSAGRRMTRMFDSLTDTRRQNAPYWLISYLEGTRFTYGKREKAVEFAKKRDLKVLDEVLQPRTKGFISTVHALRGNASAVYDVTIGYQKTKDNEMSPSFQEMYFMPGIRNDRVIHVHQRRIPLSEVPQDDKALKQWIYKLYEQKDELLQGFREKGSFDGRQMRWNRMSWAYWIRCQTIMYGSYAVLMYGLYTAYRAITPHR